MGALHGPARPVLGHAGGPARHEGKADGAVVNLCSLNGVNAHMGTTSYNIAKEALRAASRTAAHRVGAVGRSG